MNLRRLVQGRGLPEAALCVTSNLPPMPLWVIRVVLAVNRALPVCPNFGHVAASRKMSRWANSRLGKAVSMRSGVEFHRLLESLERVFSPLLEVQTRPGDQILDGP